MAAARALRIARAQALRVAYDRLQKPLEVGAYGWVGGDVCHRYLETGHKVGAISSDCELSKKLTQFGGRGFEAFVSRRGGSSSDLGEGRIVVLH